MSRQIISPTSSELSPPQDDSPLERFSDSPEVNSPSPPIPVRESESSEGYPSWLPKRPPPPGPSSTLQSSVGFHEQQTPEPVIEGRKPTPRSVRIVSVADSQGDGVRREPTDQTRVSQPGHSRVWSRATTAGISQTIFSARLGQPQGSLPRFKSNGLRLELLRNPSPLFRFYFYLLPIITFYHIPVQTFFDFNAVFILIQVAKYPDPLASGVPGSGKSWALGAAAYIACWFFWIVVVFIVYEIVYSFYRRWRIKRPLIFSIYMSSTAFNLASMTSYSTFSFMRHIRATAFNPEQGGSMRDGLAETCWYYSQNTANVALLLPRAGLSLALLLSFSSVQPGALALANSGNVLRDRTFFRAADGTLTSYARGVLIANAAWTAWRTFVFILSWLGLWIFSGHGCAGLCGPRYRWEEEDTDSPASVYDDDGVLNADALPWLWKESTQVRIQEAYDFCLTVKHPRRASKKELSDIAEASVPFAGMEQVMAAVGLPSGPQPARRGILSERLFETPTPIDAVAEMSEKVQEKAPLDISNIIPPIIEKEVPSPVGPAKALPYPFTGHKGAQVSSDEQVPFPPSPRHSKSQDDEGEEENDADKENVDIDVEGVTPEGELEDEDIDIAIEDEEGEEESSERRTSGSLSSLGQPVPSRYPFQYRRPRGGSSFSSRSHVTPQSVQTRSTHTRSTPSRSTQSTGNVDSIDSPWSQGSSLVPSPRSYESNGIPMPPRHPQAQTGQRRSRAGTIPVGPGSPTAVFSARRRPRTRTDSGSTGESRLPPPPVYESSEEELEEEPMEQPEAEGPYEEAEREDSLGLLSAAPSPRTSLIGMRHRPSNLSRCRNGSNSGGSHSRSHSHSRSSPTSRSRTQSLIHSLGAASRSSLDLVRSRANSMARLSDSPSYSQSDGSPSSPENNTFGHPLVAPSELHLVQEQSVGDDAMSSSGSSQDPVPRLRVSPSNISGLAPAELSEDVTVLTDPTSTTLGPPASSRNESPDETQVDINTADESFSTTAFTVHSETAGTEPSLGS